MDEVSSTPLPPMGHGHSSLHVDASNHTINRKTLLDKDLETIRAFVALLVVITLFIAGAIVTVTLRNWLQDEIVDRFSIFDLCCFSNSSHKCKQSLFIN